MNRQEHILTVISEECAEVSHRVCKAIRFGLSEVQEGQELTNAERLIEEFSQLTAMVEVLFKEGVLPSLFDRDVVDKKKEAFEKWLLYSKENGTLNN